MSRKRILLLFVLLVVVQLAVPVTMIDKRQTALEEGTAYKFRIGPVDPYDPFLGRYLVLNLEAADYNGWTGEPLNRGQTVYAVLETDRDGFVVIRNLSMDPPGTRDYLKLRVDWQSGPQVRLQMPFDRYYLEEHLAQQAWQLRRPGRRRLVQAYIQVRVLEGYGVLEELYFDDKPLPEFMRSRGLLSPDSPRESSPATPPSPAEDNAPQNRAAESD